MNMPESQNNLNEHCKIKFLYNTYLYIYHKKIVLLITMKNIILLNPDIQFKFTLLIYLKISYVLKF